MNFKMVLWLIIAVLVIYIAWQVWRLLGASRAQAKAAAPAPRPAPARIAETPPPPPDDEDDTDDEQEAAVYGRPRMAMPPPPPPEPANEQAVFQLELQVRQLSRELAQLRAAHQELASELAAVDARLADELRDGLNALAERIDQVPASSGLAPQYDEAMVFARRGLDAAAIAERCEISIGEAELVRSLSRRSGEGPR